MPNLETFRETEGKKDGTKSEQWKKQNEFEIKNAERRTCDERSDIREKVTRQQDCFVSSARKQVDREIKASEKPSVGKDAQLHSDTTEPGIDVVEGMKKGGWAESSNIQLKMQKDKKVQDAVKRRVFQN